MNKGQVSDDLQLYWIPILSCHISNVIWSNAVVEGFLLICIQKVPTCAIASRTRLSRSASSMSSSSRKVWVLTMAILQLFSARVTLTCIAYNVTDLSCDALSLRSTLLKYKA